MTANESTAAPSNPLVGWLGWLILSVYTLSTTLVPIRADNDVWWHLKSGEYIAEHGIPKNDVFNFKAENLEWHNHEWLSQVLFHYAYEIGESTALGGMRGAILFNALITWLTISLVYLLSRRISGRWVVAFLVAVACIAIGRRMFYVRPPTITNLMLVLQMGLLIGVAEGWFRARWLWLMVPGIAIWTNLHGGWMAGGVVLACWGLDQLHGILRDRLPNTPLDPPRQVLPFRFLAVLMPACLIATFFNPYIYHLYELPKRVLSDLELVRAIGELHSPDLFFVIDFELWVLGLFALAFVLRGYRVRLFEILIFLFFLHQAFQHVRHLSLFAIMMVPVASRLIGHGLAMKEEALRARWAGMVRVPSVAIAALALYFAAWVLINPREGGQWTNPMTARSYPGRNAQWLASEVGYVREAFPAALCDFVELADIRGPVFNENFYAGYLIWRLAPDRARVFSDSRFDIFGGDLMRLEGRVVAASTEPVDGRPLWEAALDPVDWIIARKGTGLWYELHNPPADRIQWIGVAAFPGSDLEVWLRATPENLAAEDRWEAARRLAGASKP